MSDVETIVVGAGVVGLAIARKLAKNGQEVLLLEQHGQIGSETSARNSEVVHAGIYYPAGSLKAQLCVSGKKQLYAFCAEYGVPHERLGKLIVATSTEHLNDLKAIAEHARKNGVDDLEFLDHDQARALEPNLSCTAALLSPSTGIIDSHALMLALQGDAEAHGSQIAFNTPVQSWKKTMPGTFEVSCGDANRTKLTAKRLIISAGLHASNLMAATQTQLPDKVPATHFAKGNYFTLKAKAPFQRLIYPVPEPGGLGVHITLDLAGQARFGPDVEWVDTIDYEVDPARSKNFYNAIRRYWPALRDGSLEPDYAGIRPKLASAGEPNADFLIADHSFHGLDNLVGLLGIESPGLTSCLAIADRVGATLQ